MKLEILLFVIISMMVCLNLAGVNTSSGYVLAHLDLVNNPQNFQNTTFFKVIIAIFALAVTGGVAVSFFTSTSPESYLIAPFAGILVLFVGDIISIITYVKGLGTPWINYILLPIFSGLAVMYAVSVVSWWRGVVD